MYARTFSVLFFVLAAASAAKAQTWSFGPKFHIGLNRETVGAMPVTVQSTEIFISPNSTGAGVAWGLFLRRDAKHWYAQAEAAWGRQFADFSLYNPATLGSHFETVDRYRLENRLVGGYKPLPWLRVFGGIGWIQHHQLNRSDINNDFRNRQITRISARLESGQSTNPAADQAELDRLLVGQAFSDNIRRNVLEGQLGVGADIGGLAVDLVYNRSITPLFGGMRYQGIDHRARFDYYYWSLNFGYRLLPLKNFVLQPRRNRQTYRTVVEKIPFHRNEIAVVGGVVGEDRAVPLIIESRYTRWFTRRLGLSGGLSFMRVFANNPSSSQWQLNALTLYSEVKMLPLYSRRHRLGVAAGLNYMSSRQANVSVSVSPSGSAMLVRPGNWEERNSLGWQATLDYQLEATSRLPVGTWLRLADNWAYDTFASFGISAGYRF